MSYDKDRSNGTKLNESTALTRKQTHEQKILTGKGKLHKVINSYICNKLSQFQAHLTLQKMLSKMLFCN